MLARDIGVLTPHQTTILVSLPLPEPLERLMRVFRAHEHCVRLPAETSHPGGLLAAQREAVQRSFDV